jgi:histidinol phosphatase-like enzyme
LYISLENATHFPDSFIYFPDIKNYGCQCRKPS